MNISEKIEDIRSKPEHLRIRYVWGCVAISMFVVLLLWFFSIASMFTGEKNNSKQQTSVVIPDIQKQLQTLKDQAPSLKDFTDQTLGTDSVGAGTPSQNANTSPYSAGNVSASSENQSNVYSDLQNINSSQ